MLRGSRAGGSSQPGEAGGAAGRQKQIPAHARPTRVQSLLEPSVGSDKHRACGGSRETGEMRDGRQKMGDRRWKRAAVGASRWCSGWAGRAPNKDAPVLILGETALARGTPLSQTPLPGTPSRRGSVRARDSRRMPGGWGWGAALSGCDAVPPPAGQCACVHCPALAASTRPEPAAFAHLNICSRGHWTRVHSPAPAVRISRDSV